MHFANVCTVYLVGFAGVLCTVAIIMYLASYMLHAYAWLNTYSMQESYLCTYNRL